MNWKELRANWKQYTGKGKEKCGEMTEDDITLAEKPTQPSGKLEEHYGYAKHEVREELDDSADVPKP